MYTSADFPTKKALKNAVALFNAGTGHGITYYQPGMGDTPMDGEFSVEGPHYPKPHTWYARCTAKDGVIVKVS